LWRRDDHTESVSAIVSTAASITGPFFTRPSIVFARTGDEIEVNLGSLDAPDQLMPTYESWTVRRESWLPPFPLKRRYERDRDETSRFED
jgi:hypothetical protein